MREPCFCYNDQVCVLGWPRFAIKCCQYRVSARCSIQFSWTVSDKYGSQFRSSFQVVIAGSNGYTNNTLAVPSGYNQPSFYSGNAINAPYDAQGYNTFMGSTLFNDGPFNASLCAGYCDAQTTYNTNNPASDGSPAKICKFFNTYILTLKRSDGTTRVQGQYCSLYTEVWSSKYATNSGQLRVCVMLFGVLESS